MSSLGRTFEARLLINGLQKMFHFNDLRNQRQAELRAQKLASKKNGRVLSVKKVNVDEWPSGIEFMKLQRQPRGLYLGAGVYEGDIDLDRILGLRKDGKKRRKSP